METPNSIERKLNEESEILRPEPLLEDVAVIHSPPVMPSSPTAAEPSTGWFGWLPFFSSSNPIPLSEEQRQEQIREREALEAAVLNAQEGNDDDFVAIEAHLGQQLQQAQELKAQEEAARTLEAQQLQQAQELKIQEEATKALEAQQLQQAQELKAQQEAPATVPGSTPESPAPMGWVEYLTPSVVSYLFTPPSPSAPASGESGPHPAVEIAMQIANEAALRFAANEAVVHLSTNATPPAALDAMPLATLEPEPEQTDTQTGDTKEADEQAAQTLLLEEETREREEKVRQDVLRAAAEEQARIAREERVRQNALLQQQQLEQRRQAEIACQQQAMIEHRKKQAAEVYRIGF